jgi:hypothetical protein
MERTFFRGLSRRMSNLGSGRKAAYVQRSMRDLGIESLDDEDIKPEFIKYDSFDMIHCIRFMGGGLKLHRAAPLAGVVSGI